MGGVTCGRWSHSEKRGVDGWRSGAEKHYSSSKMAALLCCCPAEEKDPGGWSSSSLVKREGVGVGDNYTYDLLQLGDDPVLVLESSRDGPKPSQTLQDLLVYIKTPPITSYVNSIKS